MHIAMIGSGYVGLVSGACFADFGHGGHLRRPRRAGDRAASNAGEVPIYEPGSTKLIADNVDARSHQI